MQPFKELSGQTCLFYGVGHNTFKLNDTVYEAVENPDDGYRSYLDSIELRGGSNEVFFPVPVALVRVSGDDTGFDLIDVIDNHIWLSVGTDHSDGYYPFFFFNYTPKPASSQEVNVDPKVIVNESVKTLVALGKQLEAVKVNREAAIAEYDRQIRTLEVTLVGERAKVEALRAAFGEEAIA